MADVVTRAARYLGNRRVEVADAEPVAPGPDQVQIDVAFTGICGTDLHILHGAMDQRVTVPAVLGHEMSGRIAATGDDVTDWHAGDPVTVMPLAWCGVCPACRAGHQHICQQLNFVGIDSPGSMQQSWTVSADLLVRLPSDLRLDHAALVEPTAVAVHDVRRSAVRAGEQAVVVGGGPIGVLIASVARSAGADILVLEPDAHRRALIAGTGLAAVDPMSVDVAEYVADWTGGAGAALSFEVSGSQPGLDTAMDVLGVRGRMVVVAIHPQPRPISLHRLFWRELTIIGARVYERTDFARAVELVADAAIPLGTLISAVEPLESASAAFDALESGGPVMKVLVDCGARQGG